MRAKHISGHFEDIFELSEGQFWGQKCRGPLENPPEKSPIMCFASTKNSITNYSNKWLIGIFIYLCDHMPKICSFYHCLLFLVGLAKFRAC
jgi:hypothetical protein